MSIEFAEKILDGMVDESGCCGERGMSEKQFDCIAQYLEPREPEQWVGWAGNRGGRVIFQATDFYGNVGRYRVHLKELWHFNRRCTVEEIKPRPVDEVEAERRLRELGRFEHSEWVGDVKSRYDMELTFVREHEYFVQSYSRRNCCEARYIYTFADADGNCIVWKTGNHLKVEKWDGDELVDETYAEPGDMVVMKATVKEHSEYRGVKQTVITRPKVGGIGKRS